ncbi:MAG TPA: hypothetical protein VMD30_00510 [Tepidisphaeraceae bacterium]|nr:hypothetical protein [Tepidisphaeraceae bacterium]
MRKFILMSVMVAVGWLLIPTSSAMAGTHHKHHHHHHHHHHHKTA